MEKLLSVDELAAILGVHPKTIAKLVAARRIPFTRPAGCRATRFTPEHVAEIVAGGEHRPVPAPSPLRLLAGGVR